MALQRRNSTRVKSWKWSWHVDNPSTLSEYYKLRSLLMLRTLTKTKEHWQVEMLTSTNINGHCRKHQNKHEPMVVDVNNFKRTISCWGLNLDFIQGWHVNGPKLKNNYQNVRIFGIVAVLLFSNEDDYFSL